MNLDELASELSHLLKAQGYKKQKFNWFRSNDGITIAFTIQKSCYSTQIWYYCFGVSINAFHEKEIRSAHSCEIQERFDSVIGGKVLGAREILYILKMWEKRFGTMEKLRSSAIKGELPRGSSVYAIKFLTSQSRGRFPD